MGKIETWSDKLLRHAISFGITFLSAGIAVFAITADAALANGESISAALLMTSGAAGVVAGVRAVLKILKEITIS